MEVMAEAIAAGAREAGADVDLRRVPETAAKQVAQQAHYKTDSPHLLIEGPDMLVNYDAIAFGTPHTLRTNIRSPCELSRRLPCLWKKGLLVGKVGAAFTSSSIQHGGQETTQFSILTNLLHFGTTIVGLDSNFAGQNGVAAVNGNSRYGASTLSGDDRTRRPSEADLADARHLGTRLARTAAKLRT